MNFDKIITQEDVQSRYDLVQDEFRDEKFTKIQFTDLKVVGICDAQGLLAVLPYSSEDIDLKELWEVTMQYNLVATLSETGLQNVAENPKWIMSSLEDDDFGGNIIREYAEKCGVLILKRKSVEDRELCMGLI